MAGSPPISPATASTFYYVVDWLPPDFGAIGQYALIAAREMAKGGRKVHLIGLTSGAAASEREQFPSGGELTTTRIAGSTYQKDNYARRLVWAAKTNARLIFTVLRDPQSRGGDLLFTGSPPFMLFFAVMAKALRRMRLTYRITDFYPEVVIAELGRRSPPLAMLESLAWALRRQVDVIEALGEDQRRLLRAGGIPPQRIAVKRYGPPIPINGQETPLARPAILSGRATLLYSGNFGVAHEVDTVVEGLIRHHRVGGRFGLWLNASGVNVERVSERLRAAGVPLACSEPVALAQLPALLAAADLHLISLRSRFAGIVLPSKVYACIASRRPILFVGPESSDVHQLCMEAVPASYARVEPNDIDGFTAALQRFAPPG